MPSPPDAVWNWTDDCRRAFHQAKQAVLKTLFPPNWDLPFELYIDACGEGFGAALYQEIDGTERPIVFISRQLRFAETRYGATQLECLGLVWSLEKLHYYLDGDTFTVITDCNAVKSLMELSTPNRHMLRWQLAIQEYRGRMSIIHREGKAHANAEGLSRAALPNDSSNPAADLDPEELPQIHAIAMIDLKDEFFETIRDGYREDAKLFRVRELMETPSRQAQIPADLPKILKVALQNKRFMLIDGLLYYKEGLVSALVVADKATRLQVLAARHDSMTAGHFDFQRTLAKVSQIAWWPEISHAVKAYVETCDVCQRAKRATGKRMGLMQRIEAPKRPWEIINMDFGTGLPPAGRLIYNACLVVVDRYTRRPRFIPTWDTADAKETALLFWQQVWSETGLPRIIISDRDPKFTSDFWTGLFRILGTKLAMSTAHHPQTDGLAERMIQTLEDMLRRYVAFGIEYQDGQGFNHDWVTLLPALEYAYSTTTRPGMTSSPYTLEKGWTPRDARL